MKCKIFDREELIYFFVFFMISCLSFIIINSSHFGVDDGYFMINSLRLVKGDLPYRDFFLIYPPFFHICISLSSSY